MKKRIAIPIIAILAVLVVALAILHINVFKDSYPKWIFKKYSQLATYFVHDNPS